MDLLWLKRSKNKGQRVSVNMLLWNGGWNTWQPYGESKVINLVPIIICNNNLINNSNKLYNNNHPNLSSWNQVYDFFFNLQPWQIWMVLLEGLQTVFVAYSWSGHGGDNVLQTNHTSLCRHLGLSCTWVLHFCCCKMRPNALIIAKTGRDSSAWWPIFILRCNE